MSSKRRSRLSEAPDITPLIDVVFLLLIFFMVSTVFKKNERALLLTLPKSEQGEGKEEKKKNITIELTVEKLAYNGEEMTLPSLSEKLTILKDPNTPVDLKIDKEVKYDRVVSILDILKKYKLNNLSLITKK